MSRVFQIFVDRTRLMNRIRREVPDHLLEDGEKTDIYFDWLKNSVEKSEALIKNYLDHKKI